MSALAPYHHILEKWKNILSHELSPNHLPTHLVTLSATDLLSSCFVHLPYRLEVRLARKVFLTVGIHALVLEDSEEVGDEELVSLIGSNQQSHITREPLLMQPGSREMTNLKDIAHIRDGRDCIIVIPRSIEKETAFISLAVAQLFGEGIRREVWHRLLLFGFCPGFLEFLGIDCTEVVGVHEGLHSLVADLPSLLHLELLDDLGPSQGRVLSSKGSESAEKRSVVWIDQHIDVGRWQEEKMRVLDLRTARGLVPCMEAAIVVVVRAIVDRQVQTSQDPRVPPEEAPKLLTTKLLSVEESEVNQT